MNQSIENENFMVFAEIETMLCPWIEFKEQKDWSARLYDDDFVFATIFSQIYHIWRYVSEYTTFHKPVLWMP